MMSDKKVDKQCKKNIKLGKEKDKLKDVRNLPNLSEYAEDYIEFNEWLRNLPPKKE